MAGTDVDAPAQWEREFVAEPASVGDIRHGLAAFLHAIGAGETLIGEVTLAVSEAATNAVVHGFVDLPIGVVRIRATPADDALHLLVADDGRGMKPRGDSPGLGLGLPTIAQLTTSFDIRDGEEEQGTEVHMVFAAPGIRAPAPAPDREAWRFELLAEVARLAGTGWPGEGVERLVALLVPAVADACVVDLVEAEGPRRLAARVDGDDAARRSDWLLQRRPPAEALRSVLPVLRGGEVHIIALSDEVNRELAESDEDLEHMAALRLSAWVNVPLTDGGVLLGALGLGLRDRRPGPDTELPFYAALGERAARGLASTHLVEELRRTRRRLERILSALSEAVTVQDARGRTVYANAATTGLLGAASVDEILSAHPGELADRFLITREDGTPVTHADLPGDHVLAGAETASLLTRSIAKATGVERWLLTKATLLEDGEPFAVNIIEDITEAKNAELRRRLLAEVGELLAGDQDLGATLGRVAQLAVPALADWCAIDLPDGARVAEAGRAGERRSELAVPIGAAATLHLATVAGARTLAEEHRVFAEQLATRLESAFTRGSR